MKYCSSIRSLGLALVLPALALGATVANAADKESVIFSSKDKFRTNWTVEVWGGMLARVTDTAGKSSIDSFLGDETKAWSGVSIQVGYANDAKLESIPLTDELRTKGVVVLSLNSGKNLDGSGTGDLQLQLSLSFVLNDGKIVNVGFGDAALPVKLDGDPSTWEKVEIPIADILKKLPDPSLATGLTRVGIQFVEAPLYGVSISECVVKVP